LITKKKLDLAEPLIVQEQEKENVDVNPVIIYYDKNLCKIRLNQFIIE
jgi:hypothetical protein